MAKGSSRAAWKRCIAIAAALVLASTAAQAADALSASHDGGYTRLLFTLQPLAHANAVVTGGVLTLSFDRKVAFSASELAANIGSVVSSARSDGDGHTFRFALTQLVRIHASASANQLAIDLVPQGFAGTPPDLPPPPAPLPRDVDPATLPVLKMRAGSYQHYTRLVFEWPHSVAYSLAGGAGKLSVRFQEPTRLDLSALALLAPPWVKSATWRLEGRNTIAEFVTDSASGFHDARDGNKIIIDVLAPKTDADTVGASVAAGASPQQLAAISAAAQTLGASATTAAAPAASDAPATAPDSAAVTSDASSALTRNGAVLTFTGAANRGSAVFIRGRTAWIVLQGAPPLDAAKLKASLGTFPAAVEAATADGVSVLRLTLTQPEEIGARADGSNLKVVIAPHVLETPIAIGFARNQDDATHASLTTLLPGATTPVHVIDPIAGDELILVPAAVGRAMLAPHAYVEFELIKTASGLVVASRIEDLRLAIDRTRLTITRDGGLALTPPTLPLADSPAALAVRGSGPTLLAFAKWARLSGGSFLATERRLRAATAQRGAAEANHARLVLARFYLANGFAAEALGLINLMQSLDPALQSDQQLQTMRSAAEYLMGRYREAHNELAGAAFDNDRHAALWRGLAAAALENWDEARLELDRAEPVLSRYPDEWRARQRIAKAETALALGRLEVADAAVARMPQHLPRRLELAAQLLRARLLAAENRGHEAARLFDVIEKSGDAKLEASALYYRIAAALSAGVMRDDAAIDALERLRFRWRGDELELKTLRKLASLYFTKRRWRDGLHTLRLAAQSSPDGEMARKAQDDMRAAFADLFIKGKADKLQPVEALAIFYDFLDLTPIGPDGDEMIRRMTERLVAVDLLTPAADLLNYQITKRLEGVARAQVATRLAMIYLLDQKPERALDTLRTTQISTLPDDVNHQRLLLEARAFAGLKRWDDALDLTAVDTAADTRRLRADIYWESGNWPLAGQKAEELLATRWSDASPLTPDEREEVMRAAVAYSLANDETSLDRLRAHFGAKMQTSPDGSAFTVVAERIDAHGVAFRSAAAHIAAVDTLQGFMQDFRKRYPAQPVSATN